MCVCVQTSVVCVQTSGMYGVCVMGKLPAPPRPLGPVVGRIMTPHDAHVLVPRTCESATFYG